MNNKLSIGCIADDSTGASDAASFLVKGGLRTVLLNGIPQQPLDLSQCDAVVIALKTRSIEPAAAVTESLRAIDYLQRLGTERYYIKYCSTFDSTEKGNIGPICDAVLEKLQAPYTILCPSLPVNGRIVRQGKLYVKGVLLEDSPMKNHPLNPMHKSYLPDLMGPQSRYETYVLTPKALCDGTGEEQLANFGNGKAHYYVVPEYVTDEDAICIAKFFKDIKVMTGGSGLLEAIGQCLSAGKKMALPMTDDTAGDAVLLAGSCSAATLEQIACFQEQGGISLKLDPAKLLAGTQTVEDIWQFILSQRPQPVLLYSSENAEYLDKIRNNELEKFASVLEKTFASLAVKAMKNQGDAYTRLIVAGGETASAVTKALGFNGYWISTSVAPGVPIMIPVTQNAVRIVLKSGNFGQRDFFSRALRMTAKGEL